MSKTYSESEKLYLKQVGERIKLFRLNANLSQEKLSFASNLDRTYIGSVERGERNVSVLNLRKICSALNTTISELLTITE